MADSIRRVVTGNDAHGKSVIVTDAPPTSVRSSPQRPGVVINNLWMTDAMPAATAGADDATTVPMALEPKANGTNFRIVEFSPEQAYIGKVDAASAQKAFGDLGAGHALASQGKEGGEAPRHPFMHRTKTIDYAIVLSGEIYLVLDKDEVLMKAGEVCIQRATSHAWSNRSDKPARVAFILIDGDAEVAHH
jgi:mannose-6-phosphate isomerase-like protein (cupin superfamily)